MKKTKSASKAIYLQLVDGVVKPFMLERGFVQSRNPSRRHEFLHWSGDALWSLRCGYTPEKNQDAGWVYVSVGVGFRSLDTFLADYRRVADLDPLSMTFIDPENPSCFGGLTQGLRGGPPYQRIQWLVAPDSSAEEMGRDVLEEIKNYGFLFFAECGTLEQALPIWESDSSPFRMGGLRNDWYLAAAYWTRGDRQRAIRHIEERLAHVSQEAEKEQYEFRKRQRSETVREYEDFLKFLHSKAATGN